MIFTNMLGEVMIVRDGRIELLTDPVLLAWFIGLIGTESTCVHSIAPNPE